MNNLSINELLEALKNENETIRNEATNEFWQRWFMQKGMYGWQLLQQSQKLIEVGHVSQAEESLTLLISDLPDFAEAWNRRAVLYYTIGEFAKSIQDCKKVLELVPFHFGAWHGLGLCYAGLGEYRAAIQAFRKALEIQPHALINQRLILECTARLN
ncbi:tetratricopeptide repeat protein [Ancylothrix sp. C2]|uniref:tetratricopeptide repeat protein n=1 Tax=Ancylothrix sp. D3o TaxID=2953691 RepID=UPI0021BB655C|nr:tetratricopeptide repeat protein [Ancylothrix sp. D3o]MCT7951087.1 tetratricopeptide repeat protein [Ancylothrix sp. D3o]